MAKLDIDFILLDDSVVMHGFRALMSGAQLDDFKKNPVLLIQHNRPSSYQQNTDVLLPIGMWYDIRVEGNKLLAKPDFDDNDPLAMKVQGKVKGGYMKGASVWIEPMVLSEEAKDMLPGQTLPTFTKWGILEASIVDIPNCRNSLAIRNSAGQKRVLLSADISNDSEVRDFFTSITTHKKNDMDKKTLCAKLGLDENVSDTVLAEKLAAIITGSQSSITLAAENQALKTENDQLKAAAATEKVTNLVDGAIAALKLAAGDREKYIKLATADFETTKSLIDGMTPYESLESKLKAGALTDTDKAELENLMKLTGEQLYMDGKLERLKELSPTGFTQKYKEAFNMDAPAETK